MWVVVAISFGAPHAGEPPLDDWLLAFGGTFGVCCSDRSESSTLGLDAGLAFSYSSGDLRVVFLGAWAFVRFAAADRDWYDRSLHDRPPSIYASYVLLQAGYLMQRFRTERPRDVVRDQL